MKEASHNRQTLHNDSINVKCLEEASPERQKIEHGCQGPGGGGIPVGAGFLLGGMKVI